MRGLLRRKGAVANHAVADKNEAKQDLHHVLKKINAEIFVLEMRAFRDDSGAVLYEFDTLYDEDDEPVVPHKTGEKPPPASLPGYRAAMLARRAVSDTVVVPAHQDGFEREFRGNHQWYVIRISAAMRDRRSLLLFSLTRGAGGQTPGD